MKKLQTILEWALLILVAAAGLKFTLTAGVCEIPASYGGGVEDWISRIAPSLLFVFLSALLLAGAVIVQQKNSLPLPVPGFLWMCLVLVAGGGMVNASTPEVASQIRLYLTGLGCLAMAANLLLIQNPDLGRKILIAILIGSVLALLYGWDQILSGMKELQEFAAAEGLTEQMDESMRRQLESDRVYGTFLSSNTYGGYLAATLPLAVILAVLRAKDRVKPAQAAMTISGIVVFLLFAVLLWMTGSRGAVLSLAVGIFAVMAVFCKTKKARWLYVAGGLLAAAGCICMIVFVRGTESIVFRLDYARAAIKMMFAHPFSGTGLGDFLNDYPGLKLLSNDEMPHSPHNSILFFGAQCGIPAFLTAVIVFLFPVWYGFKKLLRQYREQGINNRTLLTAGLLASLLVLTLHSLMEIGIEVPAYAMLLILFFLLIHEPEKTPLARKAQVLLKIFCILLALIVLPASFIGMKREAAFANLFELTTPLYQKIPNEPAIRKAYAAAPQDSPFVHLNMAQYLAGTNRINEAKIILNKALKLSPESIGMRRIRIRLDLAAGESAKEDILYLLKHDPENPENENLRTIMSQNILESME